MLLALFCLGLLFLVFFFLGFRTQQKRFLLLSSGVFSVFLRKAPATAGGFSELFRGRETRTVHQPARRTVPSEEDGTLPDSSFLRLRRKKNQII